MLKRQQETVMLQSSSLSSSRRQNLQRQQNQDRSVKPVGCLSGILHLVSKYHRRPRRKFLTFGKKQGKNCDVEVPVNSFAPSKGADDKVLSEGNQIPSSSSTTLHVDGKKKEDGGGDKICHARQLSRQVPRSPTLSVEIRQSDSVVSPDNFRELTFKDGRSTTTTSSSSPSTLVGVDEKETTCNSSAEEKRRMLLGALEKCDEDLKAIKNIIEALRTTSSSTERGRGMKATKEEKFEAYGNIGKEFKHSPISVLDLDFISPPANSKRHITNGQTVQQQKPQPRKIKNPRQEDTVTTTGFFHTRVATVGVLSVPTRREIAAWSSKAMGESVAEVCGDVDCGERREVTRIGLVLQDYIFRDLVDQAVKELLLLGRSAAAASNCLYSPLPLEACKKRMRF
ncbi:uncharacterized protein LOC131319169 [Rhododendron vialii]|uniref:uncharacterized protein LOC131319169 n=1 Tax=Rhododendron vialii TaxID=182163 RepID=UPI00265F7419|nr:uncharacterized protein LOC131319169 [Rhododendron vialii]